MRSFGGAIRGASCAALAAAWLAGGPSAASALESTFKAGYAISMGGVVIGHVSAEARFTGATYTASIVGSTSGLTRLATDASAKLAGNGQISGTRVLPRSYSLDTREGGFATHVEMAMQSGRITGLIAAPTLALAADRVPVTSRDKVGIVDPLGAFFVPLARPGTPVGRQVCNRTVRVFDGWTRFDIKLAYKETKAVDGGADSYSGRVIVCGARYVPIAGHRADRPSVRELAANDRLEVWLAEVEGLPLLVPYRILIGTRLGDLVVHSTRFSLQTPELRADAR